MIDKFPVLLTDADRTIYETAYNGGFLACEMFIYEIDKLLESEKHDQQPTD